MFSQDEDSFSPSELEALRCIFGNSKEEWHTHHHHTIKHNLLDTAKFTTHFATNALVAYFTNKPPYLQDFRDWIEEEFHARHGWRISHTQYFGKNFFLVEFSEVEDQDASLEYAP